MFHQVTTSSDNFPEQNAKNKKNCGYFNIKLHIEIGRQGNNCNNESKPIQPANRLLFHSSLDNHMQFAIQLFLNVEGSCFFFFGLHLVLWNRQSFYVMRFSAGAPDDDENKYKSRRRIAIYNMVKQTRRNYRIII